MAQQGQAPLPPPSKSLRWGWCCSKADQTAAQNAHTQYWKPLGVLATPIPIQLLANVLVEGALGGSRSSVSVRYPAGRLASAFGLGPALAGCESTGEVNQQWEDLSPSVFKHINKIPETRSP